MTWTKLHQLWYLVTHTLFAKGINYICPKSLKVSRPRIANMTLIANISSFLEWKYNYIVVAITIARGDVGDDSFAFLYAWGGHY